MIIELNYKGFKKVVAVSLDTYRSGHFKYLVPQEMLPVSEYVDSKPEQSNLEVIDFFRDRHDGEWITK